jgi:Carbohydrate binding domain
MTGEPTRSNRPGPEIIGVMFAAIIYAVIGVGVIVANTTVPEVPTPTPTATTEAETPRPTATMNPSLVFQLNQANDRILRYGKELEVLLKDDPLATADVVLTVKDINAAAAIAIGVVRRIEIQPGGETIAPPLMEGYTAVADAADKTLNVPIRDSAAVRKGAEGVVSAINALPDLDALLAAPEGSPSPSPSGPLSTASPLATPEATPTLEATPGPTASPTIKPTPEPTPELSPEPTATPSPTPSPTPVSMLMNGGFESGLEPWKLVLASGAAGTLERTTIEHFTGTASGVVDITAVAGSPSAVSVEQGGLSLSNGVTYHVSLAVKSTAAREIRVRLVTGLGEVIASRVLPVTTTWVTVSFEVTPIGRYSDVTLKLEVGASGQRIWMDDVSLS